MKKSRKLESGKVISLRLSSDLTKKLTEEGDEKLSSKVTKIIQNYFDLKYNEDHNWMMMPKPLGIYLFSKIGRAHV